MSAAWIGSLAEFVSGTRFEDIPPDVLARGRAILADCVGCIVAGSRAPEMRALTDTAERDGPALVLGTGLRRDPATAAFLNGTAGTWHDLDEGNLHTKGHAGIQIVPAALAEAERGGHSGESLLASLVLAYEASCRVYLASRPRLALHPHGTYGPLAAALAIGRLRKHDASRTAATLNAAAELATAASRGTLRDGATTRNVYTGLSGRNGFLAHDLVEAGFAPERDAVSQIFGEILGDSFAPSSAVADLGRTWWIRRNYFKRFPSARYVHSALDLVAEILQRRPGMVPDDVEGISVSTYFMAATMGQKEVSTAFGTRFSIPWAVAGMIRHGRSGLLDDPAALLADDGVRALAGRIDVEEDPSATAAYPARQPTRIEVRLRDGSVETAEGEHIRGEAENPLSADELRAKFVTLAGTTCDPAMHDALMRIETVPDVRRLTQRWQSSAAEGEFER